MDYVLLLFLIFIGVILLYSIRQTEQKRIAEKGYRYYLGTRKWRKVADASKKRDGMMCRLCGSRLNLESHHPLYRDATRQILYHEKPEDLTTLCHDCHHWYSMWKRSQRIPKESA